MRRWWAAVCQFPPKRFVLKSVINFVQCAKNQKFWSQLSQVLQRWHQPHRPIEQAASAQTSQRRIKSFLFKIIVVVVIVANETIRFRENESPGHLLELTDSSSCSSQVSPTLGIKGWRRVDLQLSCWLQPTRNFKSPPIDLKNDNEDCKYKPENTHFLYKGNLCTADLLFDCDWLGFRYFAYVGLDRDLQVWSNPNQSKRRSKIQLYLALQSKWVFSA